MLWFPPRLRQKDCSCSTAGCSLRSRGARSPARYSRNPPLRQTAERVIKPTRSTSPADPVPPDKADMPSSRIHSRSWHYSTARPHLLQSQQMPLHRGVNDFGEVSLKCVAQNCRGVIHRRAAGHVRGKQRAKGTWRGWHGFTYAPIMDAAPYSIAALTTAHGRERAWGGGQPGYDPRTLPPGMMVAMLKLLATSRRPGDLEDRLTSSRGGSMKARGITGPLRPGEGQAKPWPYAPLRKPRRAR